MKIDSDNLAIQFSIHNKRDVNGNLLPGHDLFTVFGYLLDGAGSIMLSFDLSRSDIINRAEAIIPQSPTFAQSESDYDHTGIFEAAYLILGDRCANFNRVEFYQFFHNQVKPRIIREHQTTEITQVHTETSTFAKAFDIPFCGKRFSFMELSGYDTDKITLDNPHGAYVSPSIVFE